MKDDKNMKDDKAIPPTLTAPTLSSSSSSSSLANPDPLHHDHDDGIVVLHVADLSDDEEDDHDNNAMLRSAIFRPRVVTTTNHLYNNNHLHNDNSQQLPQQDCTLQLAVLTSLSSDPSLWDNRQNHLDKALEEEHDPETGRPRIRLPAAQRNSWGWLVVAVAMAIVFVVFSMIPDNVLGGGDDHDDDSTADDTAAATFLRVPTTAPLHQSPP